MENISKEDAIKEIEKLISSGNIPVVSLDLFQSLEKITLSEKIKNELLYTLEICEFFINELNNYNEKFQEQYLTALKNADIIDNKSIDKKDSFIASLQGFEMHNSAIDKLIYESHNILDKESFIVLHDLLLFGTSSYDKTGLRRDNLKFIGKYEKNENSKKVERKISYFPLDYRNIDKAIELFLNFYNNYNYETENYAHILKPIVVHGIIASLQLFNDGNTRYGRLFQSIGLWKGFKKHFNMEFKLPFIYGSRQYNFSRGKYRMLVNNLACYYDAKAWEDWIVFNLRKITDCILFNMEKIKDCILYNEVYLGNYSYLKNSIKMSKWYCYLFNIWI